MIVLFIKSDLIRTQPLTALACPDCHKTGDLTMELRQRYADFAGGKVYPKGVFGVVQRSSCGHTMPASYRITSTPDTRQLARKVPV